MKLRILGCSGTEAKGFSPTSFLIDRSLLIDTGSVCSALDIGEQAAIHHVLITHSHLDHVRGVPLLADNLNLAKESHSIEIISIPQVLAILKAHILNNIVWPDFNKIPSKNCPILTYREIREDIEFKAGAFRIVAFASAHSVPCVGYRITNGKKVLVFSGDTGPTDRLWHYAENADALIVDVSFPDSMEWLALLSGHLTPKLLAREITKCTRLPTRIYITHIKPQFLEQVQTELMALNIGKIEILRDGAEIEI